MVMTQSRQSGRYTLTQALPWVVLGVLLLYTYAKFVEHPYLGFRVGPPGDVIIIFSDVGETGLRLGDRLVQAGPVTWDEYQSDLRKIIYPGLQRGQEFPLIVERDDELIQIPWKASGFNTPEFLDLFFSEGWLGFFFWAAGTISFLVVRPRDIRWRLMIAFNYLTAFWLVLGSGVSFYHIWHSAVLMRMAFWLSVPVYLHLHWEIPAPLGRLPRPLIWAVYSLAGLLALAEWFEFLPVDLFTTGFLIAVSGSLTLLLLHAFLKPESRRSLRLFFILSGLSLIPTLAISITGGFLGEAEGLWPAWINSGGAVGGLALLPVAYLYGAFRRQFGDLELRVNRFLTIYLFLVLLGSIGIPLSILTGHLMDLTGEFLLLPLLASVGTAASFIWLYPVFERFVERRFLGISLPSRRLLETYSNHISTSVNLLDLTRILEGEILPSLLVRQFVFLYSERERLKPITMMGVEEGGVPAMVVDLPPFHSVYLLPDPGKSGPFTWIRLILPLKLGDRTIGFWLFGRRDPDDMYSQAEIPILRSLASQTAVALSNIVQSIQIRDIYEGNILRHEEERLRLGRDLHDSVLNELALLLTGPAAPDPSPEFLKTYELVTQRLREIVSDLRPPMLNFGLKLAFEELVETLMERHGNPMKISGEVTAEGEHRYPENVEINLYRIVQEACQNALRYAHANTIKIRGSLSSRVIDLTIADDGIGFVTEVNMRLTDMLVSRHFGLANMLERANLIGAEIKIDSKPGEGTQVRVRWESKS